jgi:hypothetical protein
MKKRTPAARIARYCAANNRYAASGVKHGLFVAGFYSNAYGDKAWDVIAYDATRKVFSTVVSGIADATAARLRFEMEVLARGKNPFDDSAYELTEAPRQKGFNVYR